MFTLNDIQNKADEVKRANELSKTKGGKEVLKNIVRANLLRLIDRTTMPSSDAALNLFSTKFDDIVRPNKFEIEFGLDGVGLNHHITYLCKSFTIPAMIMNKLEFKRCGKTIKKPINIDMTDSLELVFYQDINNIVLKSIIQLLNVNQYQYHNQFIDTTPYVSFKYNINMNYDEGGSLGILNTVANFFDIDFLNGYENAGRKKHIEKQLTKNTNDKIFEFKFNNVFINNFSGMDFDMEKIDTFGELRLSLDYTGTELRTYDVDIMKANQFNNDNNNESLTTDSLQVSPVDEVDKMKI